MSAQQHCTAARAVVEARRAAGPHQRSYLAGGASLGPRPAVLHRSIATVSLRVCGNSLPASRTRRRGVFLQQRSAIKHCAPARAGADFAATPHSVSSLVIDDAPLDPATADRRGGFSRASGGDWLQPFSFPSYKSAQVFGARRHVFLLAAQIVDQFQPIRIDTHIEAVNLRLHGHGFLRQVRHVQNIWMPHSSVKCPAWDTAGGKSDASDVASFSDLTDVSVHFTLPGINNTGAAMNFKLSTLAAAAALLVNCSTPAMAEMAHLRTIGHWEITANDKVCNATGPFRDGTSLEIAFNAKGALMIDVVNPRWSINKRDDYLVLMQVDRAEAQYFPASGNNDRVWWQIPPTEASINLLSYGRTLRAQIGSANLTFDLALSEPVIKSLIQCIAPRMAVANPFAGATPPAAISKTPPSSALPPGFEPVPYAETPSNPYRRM